MTRHLTELQRAASLAPHRLSAPLLEMFFDSGTVRLALCSWPIVVGPDTYLATGPLLNISPIVEAANSLEGCSVTLSGLDPAIVAVAATEPYQGRVLVIRKARFTTEFPGTPTLIGTPTIEWAGRMRSMQLRQVEALFDVTINAEHYDIDLKKVAPRRWSDADQQRDYPGDKACEYVATMTEKYLPFPAKKALEK